ncbi:MAG: TonB-dependent receptor [Saprospiraceae bacterium]
MSLLIMMTNGSAQNDLEGDNVTVVKDFDARLLDANKISVSPNLPPLDTSTQRQNYVVPAHPSNQLNYEAPTLRPLGLKRVKTEKDYNGYLKLGGGVPTALYGEGGYYFGKAEKFDATAWLKHYQISADKALENQKFQTTQGLLKTNIFLENNLAVEGKIGFQYDQLHFYGYDHEIDTFTEAGSRQRYRLFDIGGRLYNGAANESDFNFSISPNIYFLSDYYSNKESGFDLGISATKWIAEQHAVRVTIRPDFSSFTDTAKQTLNNIYLQPSFTLHFDFMQLKIGGNFVNNRDEFSIFPDAELTLRIFGDGVQLFAGGKGDLRKNNFRSITRYNPYIQIRETKLKNTRFDNYYGGVKGDFGWLEYNAQVGYSKASDLALYQTLFQTDVDGQTVTRFHIVYDTVRIYNFQGTVKLRPFKDLLLSATLSQSVFDTELTGTSEDQAAAWGLPEIEGNFGAVYSVLDGKANLKANFYTADKIAYLDENGRFGKGEALYDLSVGGSYYFTKNFGAFLDINNLLNNKRERWYRYPTVGLNFLAGIKVRF